MRKEAIEMQKKWIQQGKDEKAIKNFFSVPKNLNMIEKLAYKEGFFSGYMKALEMTKDIAPYVGEK